MTTKSKVLTWIIAIVFVALAGFIYFKFYFVFSEGVNQGDINYFQREGFVFKTYEGKMIQTGLTSKTATNGVQSNELKFSVVDEQVVEQLNNASSPTVKLHWRRYLGTLPWRGKSQFVVDEVITNDKK